MSLPERWEAAKSLKLCYRCLGGDHSVEACVRWRICGINNSKNTHNRLLHRDPVPTDRSDQVNSRDQRETVQGPSDDTQADAGSETNIGMERNAVVLSPPQEPFEQPTERSHTTVTEHGVQPRFVALRTVPVFLKNGRRGIKVNALLIIIIIIMIFIESKDKNTYLMLHILCFVRELDETSTKTYLNADVAAELELRGEPKRVTVNVLNGQTETFETTPVEFELESMNGNVATKMSAFTAERVTGSMKVIDWEKHVGKWSHLKGIQFPDPGKRPNVDLLIGVDYAELHYSFKDVRGQPGEPVARLTPLGLTCTGTVSGLTGSDLQSNFAQTYFVREQSDRDEISTLHQKFWEIENPITSRECQVLNPDEQCSLKQVENPLSTLTDDTKWQFHGRRKIPNYQTTMAWRCADHGTKPECTLVNGCLILPRY